MTFTLVLAAALAIYLGIILGARWLQSATQVTRPDGVAYRVQVGPTGVPWIAAFTNYDASVVLAPFHLARHLMRREKTWTVEARVARSWRTNLVLLTERYPNRQEARQHFAAVVAGISNGTLLQARPNEGG